MTPGRRGATLVRMKIRDLLKARRGPLFSFEFFPPKDPEGEEALFRILEEP
ncbi:hypothetical protein MHTCC0001_36530 [Flavobacteriaceae bacterium MHTCC 0001]